VRSALASDSPAFRDSVIVIVELSPALQCVVSSALTGSFADSASACGSGALPAATFPRVRVVGGDHGRRYTARLQHLVALDCALLLDEADAPGSSTTMPLRLFLGFVVACDASGQLLPLSTCPHRLPRATAVQFALFFIELTSRATADNLVGFLFDAHARPRKHSARPHVVRRLRRLRRRLRRRLPFRDAAHVQAESQADFRVHIDAHACFCHAVQWSQ
jgi:hypothetical protein